MKPPKASKKVNKSKSLHARSPPVTRNANAFVHLLYYQSGLHNHGLRTVGEIRDCDPLFTATVLATNKDIWGIIVDEIDCSEIARFLSDLSSRATLPKHIAEASPSEFEAEDVRFDDNSWLARIIEVQAWLNLEDQLSTDHSENETAERLFSQLAPDENEPLITIESGHIQMTQLGADVLETRLARADERSARFTDALDDGATLSDASDDWFREWEELELNEPPKIKATVDTVAISEFTSYAREGELDLNPPYQREYVWSNPDSQKLIESVLRGIPLPSIILATLSGDTKLQIVDGKQRLTSLLRFVGAHPKAIEFAAEKDDVDLFTKDFRKFAKKHKLTSDDFKTHYLPFKLKSFSKDDPLRELSSKYYHEIREARVVVGGVNTTIRSLFEVGHSIYKVPILKYEDTDVKDIHKVFTIYNKQGVKLNAEEIRNAVFNHLKIVQLILYVGGDRPDPSMAEYAVEAGIDVSLAHDTINDMGFSILRFRRTKVLLWMLAALLHPTGSNGEYRAPSTASHIDNFLKAIDKSTHRLKGTDVLTRLAKDLVAAIELHLNADSAWHRNFKTKKEASAKWQELGAVASLAICFILVTMGEEERLLKDTQAIHELTKHKRAPESTQNKTQWKHISDSILSVIEHLGIDPGEAGEMLEEIYATSAIEGLIELRKLQTDG